MNLRTATAAALLIGLTGSVAASLPAQASGSDDRVIRTGTCSDGARWKIKAKEDDGRLEVEAEIDSDVSGQRWAWVFKHDGDAFSRGTSTTFGRSGSFSIERKPVDLPGTDNFVFRATHDGQTCVARVSY